MSNAAIFKEVIAQYGLDRAAAAYTAEKRLSEVCAKVPRIAEIDKELAVIGASLVKETLRATDGGFEERVEGFRVKSEALQAEKAKLLKEAGYSSDYLDPIYICSNCKDTGFAESEKCKCLSKRLIEKHFNLSELGRSFERENFDTFNLDYYSDAIDQRQGLSPRSNIKLAHKECLDFVAEFGKTFTNLLLYGDPGLGKTFLCNCIAKELIESGYTVLYATAPKLFKKMADIHFDKNKNDGFDDYAQLTIDCDLLIIDDLGAEVVSQVTASELFNFINTRFLLGKPVIISTNLSVPDLNELYSERITSRMIGEYKMLKFFGDDIRTVKKYK